MRCTLHGELTIVEAAKIKAQLLGALAGKGALELDTTGVVEADAAGLQVLLSAMKSAAGTKTPIVYPPEARGSAVSAGLDLLGLSACDWNSKDWNHG